jgi:hypothetical protein
MGSMQHKILWRIIWTIWWPSRGIFRAPRFISLSKMCYNESRQSCLGIEKHINDIDRRAVFQSGNPLLLPACVWMACWYSIFIIISLVQWTSKLFLHILVFGFMAWKTLKPKRVEATLLLVKQHLLGAMLGLVQQRRTQGELLSNLKVPKIRTKWGITDYEIWHCSRWKNNPQKCSESGLNNRNECKIIFPVTWLQVPKNV